MANPLQNEIKKTRYIRQKLTKFFNHMVEVYGGEQVIDELMTLRNYWLPEMKEFLGRIGVYKASNYSDLRFLDPEYTDELLTDFGLLVDGQYYMTDRYVLAIRDIRGDVISLVGWDKNGGAKKYLTTQTVGFNRDTSFFNFDVAFHDAYKYREGKVFLVEGIFDAVALSAIGFPAVAAMGLGLSQFKVIMLSRFSKVIQITDNDKGGRSTIPYLYTSEQGLHPKALRNMPKKVWTMQNEVVYVRLPVEVKDVDDFVKWYDVEEDLLGLYHAKNYVKLKIA